jgi:allantoinase
MPTDLIIRNGKVVTNDGVSDADVAVEAGRIAAIGHDLGQAREEIDATGLHVFPGLIDPHVHFNEPGRTEWEGFATGSAALAAGGGTCFFDMPLNAHPPTLDAASFDLKLAAAQKSSFTDFALWGGLTPDNLDHLEELADRGVVGFKAFMSGSGIDDFARADDLTLYRGMKTAARLDLPVAVHAESDTITSGLTAEARMSGRRGWLDYVRSRPVVAETQAIATAIAIAEDTGCALHIVHVSSPRGVQMIARAASAGFNVTCETCPHYLTLTEDNLDELGATAKCAPPLRSRAERDHLWIELEAGNFTFVASDHSPAPPTMKTAGDPFDAWGGIAGVQSTLAILLSHIPALQPPMVARLVSAAPAQRFAIGGKGRILVGFDADLTLVDVDARFTLTRDQLLDRHKLSPYVGHTFTGVVRRTILRGQTIFQDGRIVGQPRGELIRPQRDHPNA